MKYTVSNIFFIFVFIAGCESWKPRAVGGDDDLMVVASLENRENLQIIISAIFNDTLFTPEAEPAYKIKFIDPQDFADIKNHANVIIGAIGMQESNRGVKLMKKILSRQQYESAVKGNNHLIFARNVFSIEQNYLIINGPNLEQIMNSVVEQGPWLRKQFDNLLIKRQSKYLFKTARNKDLEKLIMSRYGWQVDIPWGYEVIRDSSEIGLFWIGKELPYRWLVIHWEEGLVFSDSLSVREYAFEFPHKYLEGIQYTNYKFQINPEEFEHWAAWKVRGLWEHKQEAQGGPFISYLFYDEKTDRSYFIHCMIFYPNKDKYLLLRQVDMVAHTFRIRK
ncbi:MAG: DUF4837 family protein [Candidatus Neomarinimicrobiota bacterium]